MALGKRKRAPADSGIELVPPCSSPLDPNAPTETLHRSRLLAYNKPFGGKVKISKLFETANITNPSTGYQILKEGTPRRSERIKNRGRSRLLQDHELRAIETVEDSSFFWGTQPHQQVADYLGVTHGACERTDFEVDTFTAAQGEWIDEENRQEPVKYCKFRIKRPKSKWRKCRFSDESHHGFGSKKRVKVHCRRGTENRYKSVKIQYRNRSHTKVLRTFAVVGWNFKLKIHMPNRST